MGLGSLSQTPLDAGGSTEATHRCRGDYARNITDQSLPETVQVLRPPGTWAVPGAFARRRRHEQGLRQRHPSAKVRSPGLPARACMGEGEGLPVLFRRRLRASVEEERNPVQRGVCGIKAPSASWGTATRHTNWASQAERCRLSGAWWQAGWRSRSQSPGSRPGLLWGRGTAMPVLGDSQHIDLELP